MQMQRLFDMQRILGDRIIKQHNLAGQDLLPNTVLALQVEIGELANELPEVFKFWSNKKNNYERALVEYCDCLHFILSIGLMIGHEIPIKKDHYIYEKDLVDQFNRLIDKVGDFSQWGTIGNYRYIWSLFLGLGELIGFTWEQIEQAYIDKNAVNHTRQDEGY